MVKTLPWKLHGEMALSCSCAVFCPCVLSRGHHPPTEGHCQAWAGIRIDDGHYGDVDLTGINLALFLEIPYTMARGDWRTALFIDKSADIYAEKALIRIFTGRAGGSTGLFRILVSTVLGVERVSVEYRVEGETRIVKVPKIIDGAITPIEGAKSGKKVKIKNADYWISPNVTVARADKSRFRKFGRNWDFAGKSAEICKLKWSGP